MSRAPVLVAAVLAMGISAACEGRPASGPSDAATPAGSPPGATPAESALTQIDASLLEVLPESINGAPVVEALEEAAIALADPTVTRIGSAVDVGLALDESTGNLVTAHILRLREGAFDDATFRQWRDSFDVGACAGADGVEGHAEVPIAERNVFVTSCVAEQRIYHLWLEDENLLISASSVGKGRFGEVLMNGLRID